MYHYMQLDPPLINERHEQMRAEASKRRLVKQLRKHHEGSGPRQLASFASWVSRIGFVGRVPQGSSPARGRRAPAQPRG